MTKEEAFKNLVALHAVCGQKDFFDKEFEEALLVAEKALEQQPCEDAVSREDLKDAISNLNYWHANQYGELRPGGGGEYATVYKVDDVERMADTLPSITSIRPKGEWKYDKTIQNWRCSKCNETPKTLGYVGTKEFMTEHFKFCNHCGADMRGKQ